MMYPLNAHFRVTHAKNLHMSTTMDLKRHTQGFKRDDIERGFAVTIRDHDAYCVYVSQSDGSNYFRQYTIVSCANTARVLPLIDLPPTIMTSGVFVAKFRRKTPVKKIKRGYSRPTILRANFSPAELITVAITTVQTAACCVLSCLLTTMNLTGDNPRQPA